MSIASITSKLRETAGPHYTIKQVRLGYLEGGKKQMLQFFLSCNKPGHKITESIQMHILDGGDDPVKKAIEIGQQLARKLED